MNHLQPEPFLRRYKFRKGATWALNEQLVAYRGVAGTGLRQHRFEDEEGRLTVLGDGQVGEHLLKGRLRELALDEIRIARTGDASNERRATVWQSAGTAERDDAMFRHHFVEAYLVDGATARNDSNLTRVAVAAWASRPAGKLLMSPPGPRTMRNWLARFEAHGLDGLISQTRLCGNHTRRISPATRLLTEELVEEKYCSEQRLNQVEVFEAVVAAIKKRNRELGPAEAVALPSLEVVRKAISELCPFVVAYTRKGKKAAESTFRLRTGGQMTVRHNERWEVDHTRLDVMVSVTPGGKLKDRPWITVVIDCHTRLVVGLWIGFDAPSAEVVCRALRQAMLPKDAAMARYGQGLMHRWPAEGLPTLVCSDQGTDNKAHVTRARLALLRCSTMFTPVLKPWYRARIERFFRTFQSRVSKTLPGAVARNILERDAEMLLASPGPMTLDDIWRISVRYIVDVYNARHHRGLECSPLEAYRLSVERNEEVPGRSEEEITRSMSWCGERTLNEHGLRIGNLFYYDEFTAAVFMRNGGPLKVPVYRSPDDLTVASFRNPEDGQWYEVPVSANQLDDVRGLTVEEVATKRRAFLAEADRKSADDGDAYAGVLEESREIGRARGHVGRTVADAEIARGKLARANEGLMASERRQAGTSDDILVRQDLDDLFGLGAAADPAPMAAPAVPEAPAMPAGPGRRKQTRKPAPADDAPPAGLQAAPAEDGDDEDLADYAARQDSR